MFGMVRPGHRIVEGKRSQQESRPEAWELHVGGEGSENT
jgi:hypothetical protein